MKLKTMMTAVFAAAVIVLTAGQASAFEAKTVFDTDTEALTITNISYEYDVTGGPAVVFELSYTNKTPEARMPVTEYIFHVFQGGIQLENTIVTEGKYAALSGASMTKIKDGAAIDYIEAFAMRDVTTELEIDITNGLSGGSTQSFMLPLTGGVPVETTASAGTDESGEPQEEDWQKKYYELLEKYSALQVKYAALLEAENGIIIP